MQAFMEALMNVNNVTISSLAWDISDTFNGLMMVLNLIGVVVLCLLVAKITGNYIKHRIHGKKEEPVLSYDADIQAETSEAVEAGEK